MAKTSIEVGIWLSGRVALWIRRLARLPEPGVHKLRWRPYRNEPEQPPGVARVADHWPHCHHVQSMSDPVRTTAHVSGDPEVCEPEDLLFDGGVAEETVDGLPVLAEVRPLETASYVSLPTVQAAAMAATGFVAGAATFALVRRYSAHRLARSRRLTTRRPIDMLPIVGSRTFLVDVHLIGKPGD